MAQIIELEWEYRIERSYICGSAKYLNELGKKGWELCACSGGNYIFKKPRVKEVVVDETLGDS